MNSLKLALRSAKTILIVATTIAAVAFGVTATAEETITLKKSELEALIKEVVDARLKELNLNDTSGFNGRVADGIKAYVADQQEQANAKQHEKAKYARKVAASDHVYGDRDAPYSLIEYSDYECPFCKRFHATPKALVEKYPDKVNWVYRHFPLGFHNPHAQKQAEAAECAAELDGNEGFWKYGDEIYKRTRSNKGFAIDKLVPLAVELGFNKSEFEECFNSGRHAAKVRGDMADGQKAGINGTPGNVIRHNESGESRLLSGALDLAAIEKTLMRLADKTGVPLK